MRCISLFLSSIFFRLLLIILSCAMIIVISGCRLEGSGDSGEDENDPNPSFISDPLYAETPAAIDETLEKVSQMLISQGISQALQAAVPVMENHDCVNSVSFAEPSGGGPYLLTEFSNGMIFTINVIRVPSPGYNASEGEAAATSVSTLPLRDITSRSIVKPSGNKAKFFDLPEFSTDVCLWMNFFEDAGYSWEYLGDWRVEDFKNLHQNSFNYVATHGSFLQHKNQDYFAFYIPNHTRNTDDDLTYIANGDFWDVAVTLSRGIYVVENEDPFVSEDTKYRITNKYIEKYSTAFPDGSIFYADCCYSAELNPYDEESVRKSG